MLKATCCALALVGVFGGTALGQSIVNIQVSNLTGTFVPGGGADDLGVLSVATKTGGASITFTLEGWPSITLNQTGAAVSAYGNLYDDTSGEPDNDPCQACGWFNGDGVGDPDWDLTADLSPLNIFGFSFGDESILSGDLDIFRVRELFNTNMLAGSGLVTPTGGALYTEEIWPDDGQQSSLSSYLFRIMNVQVDDFTGEFSGDMTLTFWPDDEHGIPEPTTLALLGVGFGLAVVGRRRR